MRCSSMLHVAGHAQRCRTCAAFQTTPPCQVFCNPNAHASAFDAKLLVTVRGVGGLRVVSEGRLSAVKSDVDALLAGSS